MKVKLSRLTASIKGRVQGVSFRYYTLREAQRLDINGWVQNERDGSVRSVAEGNPQQLEEFLNFLHHGSPGAIVRSVDIEWLNGTGEYDNFEIRWV